jgi:predicted DNA-binding transcriptional regulator YafY
MRKAARLFEIIQIVRLSKGPITAAQIAERMEVTPRSIYRDIAALQAMRVPIEGERGLGYILRSGFTLPPLMFTAEETESIIVALALLQRTGDRALKESAKQVIGKIAAVLPPTLRGALADRDRPAATLHAWGHIEAPPSGIDLGVVRRAIREERKLHLRYRDEAGRTTERTVRPIALIYYLNATNIVAWCELRGALRHFRAERVEASTSLTEFFTNEGDTLRQAWTDSWERQS